MPNIELPASWIDKAQTLLHMYGNSATLGASLEGTRVWIGASRSDNKLASYRAKLAVAYRALGATVLGEHEPPLRFESEHCLSELSSANLIVMLAASPGVSARALQICYQSETNKDTVRDRMRVYMPREFKEGFFARLLNRYGAKIEPLAFEEFTLPQGEVFTASLFSILDEKALAKRRQELAKNEFKPRIGIVTALSVEYEAVKAIIQRPRPDFPSEGLYNEYWHGEITSRHEGKEHNVVVVNGGKGLNKAAVAATALLAQYDTVSDVFMVGIAGGVPDLTSPTLHIRLGDVVVCDSNGVIQTDQVKYHRGKIEHTPDPRPVSSIWSKRITGYLTEKTTQKFVTYLNEMLNEKNLSRPTIGPLRDDPWNPKSKPMRQPVDRARQNGHPKIHVANIGTANALIRNASKRTYLKNQLNVRAFEMEAGGIAEAAWQHSVGYMVIRGICDYANDDKNKRWQPYAALAAAAVTRDLIESMPVRNEVKA